MNTPTLRSLENYDRTSLIGLIVEREKEIIELKEQRTRRNMQIKELKKELQDLKEALARPMPRSIRETYINR